MYRFQKKDHDTLDMDLLPKWQLEHLHQEEPVTQPEATPIQ